MTTKTAKPTALEVSWVCQDAYGTPVEVFLCYPDHDVTLRQFATREEALAWASQWLRDRGLSDGGAIPPIHPDDKTVTWPL